MAMSLRSPLIVHAPKGFGSNGLELGASPLSIGGQLNSAVVCYLGHYYYFWMVSEPGWEA